MKTISCILGTSMLLLVYPVNAAPSGPSARMAARLKKYPTSTWLAHYLPDDRYKIAGGIWKYVSTDLDTYYHRPSSPNMLRQSANIVIGFASAAEAEAAGYRPDASVFNNGSQVKRLKQSAGNRIIFADRLTSIALLPGWRRGSTKIERSSEEVATTDELISPNGSVIRFETTTVPQSIKVDFANDTTISAIKSFANDLRNASNDKVKFDQQIGTSRFIRVKISNNSWTKMATNGGTLRKPVIVYSFGRGRKRWNITDFSAGRTYLTELLSTLKIR